jgi:NAD(P)-dependent dehydrogenase (short-subunit alcohol dehydrogenase family)
MSGLDFTDHAIVITGAGQGVGKAYALAFAARGARVVVNDLARDEAGTPLAQIVADGIIANGGDALASTHDISTPEGGEALINMAIEKWDRLDAVIHNAGILRDSTFAKMEIETVRQVLAVHLLGSWHVAQPAFRYMRDHGGGRILLTASASGIFGNFGQSNYAEAKMGIVGMTRVLAQEGAKYNIRTNVISPFAATRLTAGADAADDAVLAPAHIAPTALILCHPDCPSNGEIFQTGGGWTGRVVIGLTEGYLPQDKASPEEMFAHWDDIRSGPTREPTTAVALAEIFKEKLGTDNLKG